MNQTVALPEKEIRAPIGPAPFFCQWETAALAQDIIEGKATPADDPQWVKSGALSQDEYVSWANHICGMACIKMVLAAMKGEIVPTLALARHATFYGAYVVEGEAIRGLIYAPCVQFLREAYGIESRVEAGWKAKDLPALMKEGVFFIASVHPSIRWTDSKPPAKGGHLVLVTAADENGVTFHNPSGHTPEAQENVHMPLDRFDQYFAGRGILIMG